jgi:hypothetical protein
MKTIVSGGVSFMLITLSLDFVSAKLAGSSPRPTRDVLKLPHVHGVDAERRGGNATAAVLGLSALEGAALEQLVERHVGKLPGAERLPKELP